MNWYPRVFLGILLHVVFLMGGCNTPNELGKQLASTNPLGTLTLVDTLSVEAETVLLDSLHNDPLEYFYNASSGTPTRFNLLLGNYNHPIFGNASANSYMQFTTFSNSNIGDIPVGSTCDSVILSLVFNSRAFNSPFPNNIGQFPTSKYMDVYTCGDSTQPFTFKVYESSLNYHQLTSLKNTKTDLNVANSTLLATKGPEILNVSTAFGIGSIYTINLGNSLGNRWLSVLSSNRDDFFSNLTTKYLNGIILATESSNQQVVGFVGKDPTNSSAQPLLVVHYHKPNDTTSYRFFLSVQSNMLAFNSINVTRSGSPYLASLQNPYDKIPTAATQGQLFIQGGTGIAAMVTLGGVATFFQNNKDKYAFTSASLVVPRSDILNVYAGGNDRLFPPAYLTLYEVNADGKIFKNTSFAAQNIYQTIATDKGSVNPIRALYNPKTESYELDITNYLQTQLLRNQIPTFVLTTGFNNQQVNGFVTNTDKSKGETLRVKVYFSKINL